MVLTNGAESIDIAFVSYLAAAQVLQVESYPQRNGGTIVRRRIRSVAGDGVIAALTAAELGMRAGLIANPVGSDPDGVAVIEQLSHSNVEHRIPRSDGKATPILTVVCDDGGSRTWLAWLPHTTISQLGRVDLTLMTGARLAYVDCYNLIADAAARAIAHAADLGVPLLLNLGGDPLTESIVAAARRGTVRVAQSSLDEGQAEPDEVTGRANDMARDMLGRLQPAMAVVTVGRLGAVAHAPESTYSTKAANVPIQNSHGAGAAFSAGIARAILSGRPPEAMLEEACAVGTAHCQGVIAAHCLDDPSSPTGTDAVGVLN